MKSFPFPLLSFHFAPKGSDKIKEKESVKERKKTNSPLVAPIIPESFTSFPYSSKPAVDSVFFCPVFPFFLLFARLLFSFERLKEKEIEKTSSKNAITIGFEGYGG